MKELNRSQKALIGTHLLHAIFELFISTFLTSYIVSLNSDNIFGNALINIGIFYVTWFAVYPCLNLIICRFVNKGSRVSMFRIGIIINTILLTALIFWGEQISKWLIVAGVLCGVSDAFYYSSYLVIKNEINTNITFKNYNLSTTILTNCVKVIVPTILGFLIDISSYSVCAIYVVILAVIQFLLTFLIKCPKPESSKFEMVKYFKFLKKNKDVRNKIKYTYFNAAFAGFKNSYKIIIVILTIYAFKTNVNLGIFTSAFSLFTMLLLILYKKIDNKPHVNKLAIYLLLGIMPFLASIVLVIWFNKATLIFYNFFLTITIYFGDYLGSTERDAIIKNIGKSEFISEHQCLIESITCICRVICYAMFIVCGLIGGELPFKIFLCILLALNPIKHIVMYKQRLIRKELEKNNLEIQTDTN